MAKKDIRDMTTDELHGKLNDTREELMKLRFQQATGELTDTSRLRVTRRQVARLMTLISERERATSKEGKA